MASIAADPFVGILEFAFWLGWEILLNRLQVMINGAPIIFYSCT